MTLDGVRVLLPQPRETGGMLREGLERLGATVIEAPVLEIAPPEDLSALNRALDRLNTYDWMAFTSRNAADAVLDRLSARREAMPSRLRVAAVGPSTAERLRHRGVPVYCRPAEATARALADVMRGEGMSGAHVLLPVGDRSRPDLADLLRAAGATVDVVPVYRTLRAARAEEAAAELAAGGVDVVALTSPSALDEIVASLGGAVPLRAVRLVCIGPTTADAARRAGLTPAAVAEPHTAGGMVAAIAGLFTE